MIQELNLIREINEVWNWRASPVFQDLIVTVPGDHHVHLNNPEVVAPAVSDFLKTKVLSQPPTQAASPNAKL